MTSGKTKNVYEVGVRKDPKKQLPTVSKARIEKAIKTTAQYTKKP